MPERYFLDANVIISGLVWKGNERKLLELGEEKKLELVTSKYVLMEVADVLGRFDYLQSRILDALVYLQSFLNVVEVEKEDLEQYWDVLDDQGDVPVLASAIKTKSILVTGDKQLRKQASKLVKVMSAGDVIRSG